MGKPYEPKEDHSKDWLRFTGLGSAWSAEDCYSSSHLLQS